MFYKKRIARVVPLYWLTTALIACALFFAPRAFNTLRLDESHLLASFFFIPWPNPAFSPGAPGEFTPLLVAGWTLNFEMMFYLLFGLAIAGAGSRLWGIISTFAIFTILIMLGARWIPNLHFYDPFLIAEFLLGCALAALGNNLQCSKATLMALLITAFAVLLVLDALDPPTSRFFSMGIPAFIALFALIQLERGGWWLASKPFTSIGNASYSIYLTHIFALAIARFAWHPFASHLFSKTCQIALCSTVILFAIAIGLLCYKFVEKPLVSFMEQALTIRRQGDSALLPETLARSNSSLALKIP